ncbi:uncharacterized protein LOC144614603 [Panthera onca]
MPPFEERSAHSLSWPAAAADPSPAVHTAARTRTNGKCFPPPPPPPPCTRREAAPAGSSGAPRAPGSARTRLLGGVGWGERPAGHRAGEGGRLPQCAPPPKPVCPDGERGRRVRAGCACAPPPGAIKASPPAATSASSCREKPVHLLQRQLLWTWTPRPALALLVVPVPATAPASVRDANAPPARRAAAPAARRSVRNAPRTVCAKVKRAPRLRPRSVAAASEDPHPV